MYMVGIFVFTQSTGLLRLAKSRTSFLYQSGHFRRDAGTIVDGNPVGNLGVIKVRLEEAESAPKKQFDARHIQRRVLVNELAGPSQTCVVVYNCLPKLLFSTEIMHHQTFVVACLLGYSIQ
jgi:hypothetical protein